VSLLPVSVGAWRPPPDGPELASDDPELRPHLKRPWLRDWVRRELGFPDGTPPAGAVTVEDDHLARHALIVGASGYGKSRLATHLAVEQFKNGRSLVFLEPSDLTVLDVLDALRRERVPADRITLAMPGQGRPFAWNPVDAAALGTSGDQATRIFLDALREIWSGDTAVRWPDMLRGGLLLASAHGLTPRHALLLLRSAPYRESLLRRDPVPGLVSRTAYRETLSYFRDEYPAVSRGDAVLSVTNKMREAALSPFLSDMFCSGRESFRLGSLWREPRVLVVNLHPELGDEGGRLLGTLLIRHLFAAALREGGRGGSPVVLFLDEIAQSQDFLGKGVGSICQFARKYDLRLVAATQHLYKVDPDLREDLLVNASVKAFFRLGKRDADEVAEIAAGADAESPPARVRLRVAERDRRYGTVALDEMAYPLRDARGEVFRARPAAWEELMRTPRHRLLRGLDSCAAASGVPGPITAAGEALPQFLEGLSEADWELCGPVPLSVRVRFPRPLAKAEGGGPGERAARWRHRLMNQDRREAVLFSPASGLPREIRVVDVPDRDGGEAFLDEVLARNDDGTDPEDEAERMERAAMAEAAPFVPAPPAPKLAPKAPPAEGKKGKAPEPAVPPPGWEDDSVA